MIIYMLVWSLGIIMGSEENKLKTEKSKKVTEIDEKSYFPS